MPKVDIFSDPAFAPLSNFATGYGFWTQAEVPPLQHWWPSAEHFLQAGKFADPALQERIRQAAEPGEAKALGRRLQPLRPDWDGLRRGRVHRAMLEKLWAHQAPRQLLLGIPDGTRIVNGNPVDPFFGTGQDGSGQNVIGEELQALRTFFRSFPERRLLRLRVADVGEPFEPHLVRVDLTGISPDGVAAAVMAVMGLPPEAVEGVALLTEDGFERSGLQKFADAAELEAFFAQHEDCEVELRLVNPALVTLWDATNDCHLARAELRHLCPCPGALLKRAATLQPLVGFKAFSRGITMIVDGDEDGKCDLDDASFPRAVEAAAAMADVMLNVAFAVPAEPQPPALQPPAEGLGPPEVKCGDHTACAAAQLADRVRGVVWGAALGDAVGLATEFMRKPEAASKYPDLTKLGPASRVQDKHRSRWTQGDWTDDTDQLVMLLDAVVHGRGLLDQQAFARELKRWRAQGFPELGDRAGLGIGQTVNAVLDHPAYDVAPDVAASAVWQESGRTVAANGAVMRCAAGALTYFWDDEAVAYNAAAGSAVTHADPRCAASCVAVASLVARMLRGVDVSTLEQRQEVVALASVAAARHLDGGDADELWRYMNVGPDGLEGMSLGEGGIGYTYKPLGAACWAFAYSDNFAAAITAITMEAGDADSNAAVAGAVLGARLGYSGLPQEWLAQLPLPQVQWMQDKVSRVLHLLGLPEE